MTSHSSWSDKHGRQNFTGGGGGWGDIKEKDGSAGKFESRPRGYKGSDKPPSLEGHKRPVPFAVSEE